MKSQPTVWWVGIEGTDVPTLPAHAYPLIAEEDARLRRPVNGKVALWWADVPVRVHDWTREPNFNLADCVYQNLTAESVALMLESCLSDGRTHPSITMRAVFGRCAVHLEWTADQLARAVAS